MQYNDTNGDLHITDNVYVPKNIYLSSGTTYVKKVAAISMFAARADLSGGGALTINVPANEAPNFINVQASARMSINASGGTQEIAVSISRPVTMTQSGTLTIGSLYIHTWGLDHEGNQEQLSAGSSTFTGTVLVAGVDYDPTLPLSISIGPENVVGNVELDDTHRLSLICG